MSLCFRCENRAKFLDSKGLYRPRFECGEIETSKFACYCYTPVRPCILAPLEGDKRPIMGPAMISARLRFVEVPEALVMSAKKSKKGFLFYWIPDETKTRKSRKKKES